MPPLAYSLPIADLPGEVLGGGGGDGQVRGGVQVPLLSLSSFTGWTTFPGVAIRIAGVEVAVNVD